MRKVTLAAMAMLAMGLVASPGLATQDDSWSFSGIDRIELDGVSGDLRVERSSGDGYRLSLESEVRPAGAFRPRVRQEGGTLWIEEDWSRGSSSGRVTWTLSVPVSSTPSIRMDSASGGLGVTGVEAHYHFDSASGGVTIRDATIAGSSSFDTASGSYRLENVSVGDDVGMDTASGDIDLDRVIAEGHFAFDTASGDIRIRSSQGILRASSASGRVEVLDTTLGGPSRFSSASGDVVVQLSQAPTYDLEASSASGNVRYEAPFGADFTLVMTKREDRGSLETPFEFTAQERIERHGQWYEEKTARHGAGSPEIRLRTASGSVIARESR